ncbi:MAG: DUF3795 domain-containing protein [Promethearchaeota archaeon]
MNLACCGDDCSYCPRYHLNLKNTKKDLTKIATLFMKVGWRENIEPVETIRCMGCDQFNGICEYNIRECCLEKRIKNCGICEDYPCYRVKKAFKITKENTEKFKTILSKEDYDIFNKAFFQKKENLENIGKDHKY